MIRSSGEIRLHVKKNENTTQRFGCRERKKEETERITGKLRAMVNQFIQRDKLTHNYIRLDE